MPRLITLSRAARLVGVKRGALQTKIQQGELRTFEGELLLADLLQTYPQTQVEDTTMLERVEHIMEQAVNKIVRPANDDVPDSDTLAARILALGQELAQARQEARRYNDLVTDLKQKLDELGPAAEKTQEQTFNKLKDWFTLALAATETQADDSDFIAREAFLRVMAAQVRILPSGHEFFIEGSDSILEAGLRGGLALDYGCSNGNCGKCKAKVVSGQVKKIRPHDYVLSETEKGLGYILTCSNTAVTDVVLEAEEALGSHDIPQQEIDIRVKKTECPDDHVVILHTKTPRTSRLRFLAGQYLSLKLDGLPAQDCSVASCPCDDMNLQFHIALDKQDPIANYLDETARTNDLLTLEGPVGSFALNENSPNPLVFIAQGIGFASIKGLIEHAMALDVAEKIYLFWIADSDETHYLNNLCRAWNDALDNFEYVALETAASEHPGDAIMERLSPDSPTDFDYYLCGDDKLRAGIEQFVESRAIPATQFLYEKI